MTPTDYRAGLKRRLADLNAQAEAIRATLESYQHAEAITLQAEGAHHGALLLRSHADTVSAYAYGDAHIASTGSLSALSITIDPVLAMDLQEGQEQLDDPGDVVSIGVTITQPNRSTPTMTMRANLHPEEAANLAEHMRQIAILMETAANRAQEEVMAEFPLESQSPAQAADPMTAAGQEG